MLRLYFFCLCSLRINLAVLFLKNNIPQYSHKHNICYCQMIQHLLGTFYVPHAILSVVWVTLVKHYLYLQELVLSSRKTHEQL